MPTRTSAPTADGWRARMNHIAAAARVGLGHVPHFDRKRFWGDADEHELTILASLADPVLDLGCGPGRIAAALTTAGRDALGVDVSEVAVDEARRRGARAVQRSAFDPLPNEGGWRSVVLFDGNIGIGGNPVRLLRRARELLAPGGTVVTELDPPGRRSRSVRVPVDPDARVAGAWVPWYHVSADDIERFERSARLTPCHVLEHNGRWFSWATKR